MQIRKMITVLFIGGLVLSSLVACSKSQKAKDLDGVDATSEEIVEPISQNKDEVTIGIWELGTETDASRKYIEEAISGFYKETGINVTYEFISWDDAYNRIVAAIASNEGADVLQMGTTWVATMISTDAFVDLTSDIGTIFPDGDAFTPGAWATSGFGGKVYAIPWFSDVRAMVYRSDLWAEAGYPNGPQTWEGLQTGAKKIKELHPEIESVIGLGGQGFSHYVGSFFWQNCGDFISPDGGTATFNDPKNAEATQFWVDLIVDDGTVSKTNSEWTYDDVIARFWEGDVATMFVSPAFVNNATEQQLTALEGKIGVTAQPAGNNNCQYNFVGGSDLMLFKYSTHQEEAKQFMAYLAKPEIQVLKAKYENDSPAVKAAYDLVDMTEGYWPGFAVAAQHGFHFPIHPAWGGNVESLVPELVTDIWTAIVSGEYADTTVQDILDAINLEAQQKLNDAGGAPTNYNSPWPVPNI
jgi:multiple sugar transport system substrate-binding protein